MEAQTEASQLVGKCGGKAPSGGPDQLHVVKGIQGGSEGIRWQVHPEAARVIIRLRQRFRKGPDGRATCRDQDRRGRLDLAPEQLPSLEFAPSDGLVHIEPYMGPVRLEGFGNDEAEVEASTLFRPLNAARCGGSASGDEDMHVEVGVRTLSSRAPCQSETTEGGVGADLEEVSEPLVCTAQRCTASGRSTVLPGLKISDLYRTPGYLIDGAAHWLDAQEVEKSRGRGVMNSPCGNPLLMASQWK